MLNEPQIKKRASRINDRLNLMLRSGSRGVKHILSGAGSSSGKRMRGLMLLLSNEACGGKSNGLALNLSCSMEILHQATLIHDDVVDDSDKRRGITALHRKVGAELSVLAGDYMLALATSEVVNAGRQDMLKAAMKAVKYTCEGEIEEIYERFNPNLTEKRYLEIISKKTAYVISVSCELGALSSDNGAEFAPAFAKFGLYTGIAFQIKDDVLDVIGNANYLGKPTGSDIREGKVTLPLIAALKNAPKKISASVRDMIRSRECVAKAEEITGFIKTFGGADAATKSARDWLDKAFRELDNAKGLREGPREILKRLALFSVDRNN